MTTRELVTDTCGLCGTNSEHPEAPHGNPATRAPDLDSRPADTRGAALAGGVRCCPECGYCAGELYDPPEGAARAVESDAYQATLGDDFIPELARHYLCKAIVEDASGEVLDSFRSRVRAAWACDDAEDGPTARRCRLLAVRTLERVVDGHDPSLRVIQADLLRRAGRFEQAGRALDEAAHAVRDELLGSVVAFERQLVRAEDPRAYTVDDAVRFVAR